MFPIVNLPPEWFPHLDAGVDDKDNPNTSPVTALLSAFCGARNVSSERAAELLVESGQEWGDGSTMLSHERAEKAGRWCVVYLDGWHEPLLACATASEVTGFFLHAIEVVRQKESEAREGSLIAPPKGLTRALSN